MEDADLVAALLDRREEAYTAFVERYRSLFHHCIGQFEADAGAREDLFQDLTWYALERLHQGSYSPDKGSFGTWLYRVAWCRCVDRKRQQSARRQVHLHALDDHRGALEQEDGRDGPPDEISQAEIARVVRSALRELEPEDRALLELRLVEDRILPDIAGELGITVEQVKYRLKRACQNLRRALVERLPRQEVLE